LPAPAWEKKDIRRHRPEVGSSGRELGGRDVRRLRDAIEEEGWSRERWGEY